MYSSLKNEAGVHRVQRIPTTEKSGRIHTSTASVAVLPVIPAAQIKINPDDLEVEFFRSGGHGGQNVNKISSRVTLLFDVAHSSSLSEQHKHQIMNRLKTRINKEGVLRVVSQLHRQQAANREVAVERFVELLQEALKPVKTRKKTRISFAAQKRRLKEKKHRSKLKKERVKPAVLDE